MLRCFAEFDKNGDEFVEKNVIERVEEKESLKNNGSESWANSLAERILHLFR